MLAEMSGRRAVEMALARGPRPLQLFTAAAFDNAIRADMAIGGSTNAIVHLIAIAGRTGVPLPLRRFRPVGELIRTGGDQMPRIQFPLNGSRIDVDRSDGGEAAPR